MVVATRVSALFALVFSLGAHATTVLALDVPALTRGSAIVVRGTVQSSTARWTQDKARIITDTVIAVNDTWKGTAKSSVTVMQPGGEIGDFGQVVHGTVKFTAGEEVVLFLEARGDRYLVTGMVQGRFKVENGGARQELENEAFFLDPATHQPVSVQSLSMPVTALKQQVLAAVAPTAPVEPTTRPPVKVTP